MTDNQCRLGLQLYLALTMMFTSTLKRTTLLPHQGHGEPNRDRSQTKETSVPGHTPSFINQRTNSTTTDRTHTVNATVAAMPAWKPAQPFRSSVTSASPNSLEEPLTETNKVESVLLLGVLVAELAGVVLVPVEGVVAVVVGVPEAVDEGMVVFVLKAPTKSAPYWSTSSMLWLQHSACSIT